MRVLCSGVLDIFPKKFVNFGLFGTLPIPYKNWINEVSVYNIYVVQPLYIDENLWKSQRQTAYLSEAPLAKDLEKLEVVHGVLAELGDGGGGGCDAAMLSSWLLFLLVQAKCSVVLTPCG